MSDKTKQRSWHRKIPTNGGTVAYLTVFDNQPDIRIPLEMPMPDGIYRYINRMYLWFPKPSDRHGP